MFTEEVRPELAEQGIEILRWDQLTADEKDRMDDLFAERIFPVLTPLAVDPSHPFPYISGLSINLAVLVRNPETGVRQFARVKVPTVLSRFIPLAEGRYVPLEDVIARHLDQLFSGMQVVQHHTFRVTRNEDVEVEEDDAENLLLALEKELLRRRVGRPPVRLEVEDDIDPKMLELLISELDISEREVFHVPGSAGPARTVLAGRHRPGRAEVPGLPALHPPAPGRGGDGAVRRTCSPRSSSATCCCTTRTTPSPPACSGSSSRRPRTRRCWRSSRRSTGPRATRRSSTRWSRRPRRASRCWRWWRSRPGSTSRPTSPGPAGWSEHGCHVVYGLLGLKTHCKLSMVVRDEPEGLRRYVHIGTGNYNPKTARLYEDMGLLTANPIITEDVGRLFNHLSGMSQETQYKRLLVAPHGIRTGLLDRINNEIANHEDGKPAGIRIKVNSLVDETITDALYRASQAGVPVDLWVRGICTMRPGAPGLSENIRVRSILGRFLEHSRLFWFANGGSPTVGIGSADLMHRNLDRRVEVLASITNPAHVAEISNLFDIAFDKGTASWKLQPDGTWIAFTADSEGQPLLDMQEYLINATSRRRAGFK